jgi:pimeloyl-ACP methyl ester carboxylesterase
MQRYTSPTIVLVHGAWADGSSWYKVISALHGAGMTVMAAPIPLSSLTADVAALSRALDRVDGPVVVAGHAYAGAVIGACADPKIAALVYIAALAPDTGETVADVFYRSPPHPQAPQLEPDGAGYIWLPANAFPAAFAQNASADELVLLAAVQRPISVDCIQQPVSRPHWRDVPSWYLCAEEDRMIAPDTQTFMASRMGAHVHTGRVDHTPLVSAPHVVTAIITAARDYLLSA